MLGFVLGAIAGYFLKLRLVIIILVLYVFIMLAALVLDVGPVNVSAFLEQGAGALVGAYFRSVLDKNKAAKIEAERRQKESEKLKNKSVKKPAEQEQKEEAAPEKEREEEQEQIADELPQLNEWKD